MADKQHNYIEELNKLAAAGKIGTEPGVVKHIHVLHDAWCAAWSSGFCDCACEVVIEDGVRPADA